jgi:RsiW-degrading membrane proteinase PrsW (M82 family)
MAARLVPIDDRRMRNFILFHKRGDVQALKGQPWAPRWWAVLAVGLVLWIATVATAFLTLNLILLPTIVLLGSFLIPVTAVAWYLDHDPSPALSPRRIASAFIVAGVMGALGASLLEFWFVGGSGLVGFLKVGLIEEFVKGAAIVMFALGLRSFATRDGMVLGATVGFGFAALESSGYALASLFVVQGGHLYLSLSSVVFTELVRGLLAPVGHGLWSAILGGVIFHYAGKGHPRAAASLIAAYLGISLLHAAYDLFGGIPGYIVVSMIGIVPLVYVWWRADRGFGFGRRAMTAGEVVAS